MKRVLFFAPFGAYTVHHQLDAIVATALRMRACETLTVRCDRLFEVCDVLAWSGQNAERDCIQCQASGDQLFEAFQLPIAQLRAQLTPSDFGAAEKWIAAFDPQQYSDAAFEGVEIGKWVTSSTYSHFRITAEELSLPHVRQVHRAYLKQGLLTFWALERIVDQFKPSGMMVFNGRFAPYSVAFQVAMRRNIPVVVHERGMADETFVFTRDYTSVHAAPIIRCTTAWMDAPLNQAELERTKQYFVNREHGHDSNYKPFFEYRADYATVRQKLNIPADAKIFGVFTSSEFELAFSDDFRGVTQQLDVLEALIEIFRSRPEYLVIRHHPLISSDPETNPDWKFLSRALRQAQSAPPNVRIIMPAESFSTYELLPSVSAGIAFISTIGVEAAARGIAMACFRESLYRPALPFAVPSADRGELEQLVNGLFAHEKKFGSVDLQKLYRYTHGYVQHFSVGFKSFGMNNLYQPDIRLKSLDDLNAGVDPAMDRICDHFMLGSEVMDMPSASDLARPQADEQKFFAAEILALKELRAGTLRESKALEFKRAAPQSVSVLSRLDGRSAQLDSIRKQRFSYWDLHQIERISIADILAGVSKQRREFVLVSGANVWYDQAALATAIEAISTSNKGIACFGAALMNREGELFAEDFTKRVVGTFRIFRDSSLRPERTLEYLLSLMFWRRASLMEWLGQMQSVDKEELLSKSLLELRQSDQVVRVEKPLAYVSL